MREVPIDKIVEVIRGLFIEANTQLGPDIVEALDRALEKEESPLGQEVLAELYGCYVFYTNRAGQEEGVSFWGGSEIVFPNGQLLIKAPYFQEACLAAEVDTREIRRSRLITPISRDENIDLTLRELIRIYEERFEGKY